MAKSTAARAEARFKQLSCLGLDGEAVIPALLNELHALIPSFANTFFFSEKGGVPANIYFENPEFERVFPLYLEEFHERRDHEFKGLAFSEAARTQFGVHELKNSVDEKAFRRSDLYNLILRPVGNDSNFLRLIVRDGERVLGGLSMWRSKSAGGWTSEEKRRLASLEFFFVHALSAMRTASDAPLVDSGRSGLIIADPAGKLIYSSSEARRLLYFATHPQPKTGSPDRRGASLPPALVRLCRNLAAVFSGNPSAEAPVHLHRNVWGGFAFRAQWLEKSDSSSGLIGITIRHEEPLPLKLMRNIHHLPLSERQAEVCLLMANGASNEKIAERLGMSKHTAIAHGRWIYNKLDVHNRAELVSKILSA